MVVVGGGVHVVVPVGMGLAPSDMPVGQLAHLRVGDSQPGRVACGAREVGLAMLPARIR